MIRYFSELMWFPPALLEDNMSFQAVDAASARVPDRPGQDGQRHLMLRFRGRVANFVARRYAIAGSSRDLRTWSVPVAGYGGFEGLRLPVRVTAVWKLAEGDREGIDVTLTGLH